MVPIGALFAVGVIGGVAAWMNVERTMVMMAEATGAGGTGGFTAVLTAVTFVSALTTPFVVWFLYAGAFHLVSAMVGGEGEFQTTLTYTAWGFLPKLVSAVVGLAATWWALQAVPLPNEFTERSVEAYTNAGQSHSATLGSALVGVLVLAWSASIWVAAVQAARDVDRTDTAIAVGVPLAIALVLRLGSFLT